MVTDENAVTNPALSIVVLALFGGWYNIKGPYGLVNEDKSYQEILLEIVIFRIQDSE